MMTMLAADNHLQVDMAVGTLLRSQPVVIESDADILATEFTLTGGLGYTPVTIKGLARPDGWRLEQATATGWERVDQSVEGNDYWQAYDDRIRFRSHFQCIQSRHPHLSSGSQRDAKHLTEKGPKRPSANRVHAPIIAGLIDIKSTVRIHHHLDPSFSIVLAHNENIGHLLVGLNDLSRPFIATILRY